MLLRLVTKNFHQASRRLFWPLAAELLIWRSILRPAEPKPEAGQGVQLWVQFRHPMAPRPLFIVRWWQRPNGRDQGIGGGDAA